MNRPEMLQQLRSTGRWDVIIIGGGATGLGCAVEAAARGYRTLLLEQGDFAQGTSSRSTKLIHGGVRYLKQGNLALVLEALHERGLLRQNAPHLVHHLAFVVPLYDWWEGPFYGIGLKLYDMLAGKLGLGPSQNLSREDTLQRIPTLEPKGLRGGVIYYDGQFDDARLAICLAQTAAGLGATVVNYVKVTALLKAGGLVTGVAAQDTESGERFDLPARVVINATGVFCDAIRQMDDPHASPLIAPSQGVHLVLDRRFLPSDHAIMVPHTDDGRVLFAIPWHHRTLVGTTDTPVTEIQLEPRPLAAEVEFLLTHAARYLTKDPTPADVLSVFAGLRPLVKSHETTATAALSRDHSLILSPSGLLTITGGKWTIYRKMAQDTIDQAAKMAGLPEQASPTHSLRLHGWQAQVDSQSHWSVYGSEAAALQELMAAQEELAVPLHPNLPYRAVEVVWAARQEMARSVSDVLARRTRALLLDAAASMAAAPAVARLLAEELGRDADWQARQVGQYRELARGYLL
ncbi:MAG: glycerol-3-phosphate dehydrogenase/oxidase [candidate division KSB1 bacterium]|nr:glycerol-3-phosphate dehydrogenase/oxidase [candidate division KSB1 bacterium]MDZ7275335.1 glycerol-3-phosphate dehydrogenase/oxidase [candidate division KSB1 bacterium]MDZ7287502.1 glycerol-3-phosphate dehydrogenase/oxidase [candidate division KSB1 bacterium]MDZ7299616.1 glycerol-3-phosphate dehydrogenase/oxidase [candidate division KSB1 bacterium]MDZ7307409.1 glycerol-3-phosphate dehydrogenase/oxidase [candidate division KSB1 bacterium]